VRQTRIDSGFAALGRQLERERQARKDAERLLEQKSAELFRANQALEQTARDLEERVRERVADLRASEKRFRDEQARVAEQLRDALARAEATSEFKSRFLANMSHEIRTPMTAVLGFADLLRRMPDVTDEVTDFARAIYSNADHLLAVLDDILDLSKIEAGQLTVRLQPCDPAAIVESVVSTMRVQAVEKMLEFRVEYGCANIPRVRSDAVRLKQILSNLVSNAIKFTDEGSVTVEVDVEARSPDRPDVLCFRVIDTGVGIAAEALDDIFEPFTQVDGDSNRRHQGTGLGLDISARLANMLGGELLAHSEPGRGSTFELRLPLTEEMRDVGSTPVGSALVDSGSITHPDLDGRRVAVIDDNPFNQQLVRLLLERSGAQIETASDGAAGVRMVLAARDDGRPFDLILMDIQMPVMDGYDAARRLREAGVEVPIVAFTAHAMVGDQDRCLEVGCDAYVSKPIVPQAFFRTLGEQLQRRPPAHAPESAATDLAPDAMLSLDRNPTFRALRQEYVAALKGTANRIRKAHAIGEYDELRGLAHRLAGTAATYGFPSITEAARACELALRADPGRVRESLVNDLVGLLEAAHAESSGEP
jgi:signal transduction histidine kinase/DNA-binding response OmpR family regulator